MDTPASATPLAEDKNDLGFGTVVATESKRRLLNKDGSFNVRRRGLGFWRAQSLYHYALAFTWPRFLTYTVFMYLAINIVFAFLLLLCGPNALGGADARGMGGDVLRAFFFSVETFATIGYGEIIPVGLPAHVIMVVEALVSLMSHALITGLIFARFARPRASILFSRNMIVAPFQGGRALMFRITNLRENQLIDVRARVICSFIDSTDKIRQFRPLTLERDQVNFFPLAWTIVHPITEASPIAELTAEHLYNSQYEFLVIISATDETFSQVVHARSSYTWDEVLWGARFRNIFNPPDHEGMLSVELDRIDDIDRVALSD